MRTRWMLALLLAGCAADSTDPTDDPSVSVIDSQNGACTGLEGRSFSSVEQHECGISPGGVVMCHWQITFSAQDPQSSMFMWSHSDVGENGAVRCTGRQLSSAGIGRVHTGAYDPATRTLTWDGLAYAPR